MRDQGPAPTEELASQNRERIAAAPPRRVSPWTRKQQIVRVFWQIFGGLAWRLLPAARPSVRRLVGGTVGTGCQFGRGVEILIPWNLRIGNRVEVGDRAILYALGPIEIGDGSVIDYRGHLCAGTHDFADPGFPQTRPGIRLGANTFVGIDAYIGPGVTLGEGCRVHSRASVYRSFDDGVELQGNPAKRVKLRDSEAANE